MVLQFKKSTRNLHPGHHRQILLSPHLLGKKVIYVFCFFHFFIVRHIFLVEHTIKNFLSTSKGKFTSLDPTKASCFIIFSLVSIIWKEKTFLSSKKISLFFFCQKSTAYLFVFFSKKTHSKS